MIFYEFLRRKSSQSMKFAFEKIIKKIKKMRKFDPLKLSISEEIFIYSDFGQEFSQVRKFNLVKTLIIFLCRKYKIFLKREKYC